MSEYQVSYCIGEMFHSYVIDAKDEDDAQQKVIKSSYHPELISGLKVKRHFPEWN